MLWDEVQGNAAYKDKTTMLVLPELGRDGDQNTANGFLNHRSGDPSCRNTWLLAMGAGGKAQGDATDVRQVNGVRLLARAVSGIDLKDLRSLADEGKRQVGSGIVAIVATAADGKAGIVVGVTDDLTKRFNAVDLVKKGAEVLGGKGGCGRPDMAQAGGPDGSKAEDALKAIEAALGG